MTKKKIINRLIKGNWYLRAKDDHDLALILNACHDAKLTWISGKTKVSKMMNTSRIQHILLELIVMIQGCHIVNRHLHLNLPMTLQTGFIER